VLEMKRWGESEQSVMLGVSRVLVKDYMRGTITSRRDGGAEVDIRTVPGFGTMRACDVCRKNRDTLTKDQVEIAGLGIQHSYLMHISNENSLMKVSCDRWVYSQILLHYHHSIISDTAVEWTLVGCLAA
jgi:hypothetical protein